eukprot:scaffold244_cov372-Pavlova_lutheri.AAC.14
MSYELHPNLSFRDLRSFVFCVDSAWVASGVPKSHPFWGVLEGQWPMRFIAPMATFLDPTFS